MDHDDNVSGGGHSHKKGVFGAFKNFLGRDKQKEPTPSESGQPALEVRESVRDYLQSLHTESDIISINVLTHRSGMKITFFPQKQNL